MDRDFPSVLFPSFYTNDPPDSAPRHCAGSWGSYGQVQLGPAQPSGSHSIKVQHEISHEVWRHTEPVPMPLFSPKNAFLYSSEPVDPLNFSEHLENFFMDYPSDAFSPMASLLSENVYSGEPQKNAINMRRMSRHINRVKCKSRSRRGIFHVDTYSCLLSDSVHSVPVELLSSLLHEELELQNLEAIFNEANTGGALDFIPFTSSPEGAPLSGCLVYCANGVDQLCFQQVALRSNVVQCDGDASSFLLKGPIHQISSSSTCGYSRSTQQNILIKSCGHCFCFM